MRSKPLQQWLLFALLWGVLLFPIILVTHERCTVDRDAVEESSVATAWVSLRFSSLPTSFALSQDSTLLWEESQPTGLSFEREVPIRFDRFGVELALVARLPEETAAVELTLEADGRPARSRTLWGSGEVDEAIAFTWGSPDAK